MTFIDRIMTFWSDYRFLVIALLFVGWIYLTRSFIRRLPEMILHTTRRVANATDEAFVHTFSLPLAIGFVILGVWIGAEIAGLSAPLLDGIRRFTQLGLLALVAFAAIRFTDEILHLASIKNPNFKSILPVASTFIKVVAGVIVLLVGLEAMGISTLPLSAIFSIFTLVSGLGMRPIIENFFAGLALRWEGRLVRGARIELQEGGRTLGGTMEEIGWRNVRVRNTHGGEIFIPNTRWLDSAVEITNPTPRTSEADDLLSKITSTQ